MHATQAIFPIDQQPVLVTGGVRTLVLGADVCDGAAMQ